MIVEVVWDDAHVTTDGTTRKKAKKIKPERTHTIGYLICETKDGVVLATDRYPNSKKHFGIVNFIPWGMVVEWYEYD